MTEKQEDEQWLVIIGDFEDGFTFVGPFNNYDNAIGYAGTNPNAHVIELIHPDDVP